MDDVGREEFEHFIAEMESFRKDVEGKLDRMEKQIEKINDFLQEIKEKRRVSSGQKTL